MSAPAVTMAFHGFASVGLSGGTGGRLTGWMIGGNSATSDFTICALPATGGNAKRDRSENPGSPVAVCKLGHPRQ